MPRKPRIEYADAIYHVMNRGNYRDDIFLVEGSGGIFEKTLFEACARFGWMLHAYVAMSNHYHLALQTPDANLVQGMQWFQSTFGNRFNRLGSIYTVSRLVAQENRRPKGRRKLWHRLLTAKR